MFSQFPLTIYLKMSANNNLSVALNISSGSKQSLEVSSPPDYFVRLTRKTKDLFDGKQFCDVTLISEDDEYKVEVHKLVLSAASPYFLAMFGGSLREAGTNEAKLQQISGQTLQAIVNYIYTSSIKLTTDTVEDVIKAAHLLQLDSLVVLCSDFIAKQLDVSNCIGFALFAEHYGFEGLGKIAEEFVCKNFMKLRNGDEFFMLNADQLSKYIASDELCLPSEEEVFRSVMSWVEHDKEKRGEYIAKLLEHIRFPLLAPEFIAKTMEPACQSAKCERLFYNALKWHFLPDLRSSLFLFPDNLTCSRKFTEGIIAISGWDIRRTITAIAFHLRAGFYHFGEDKWAYKKWPNPSKWRSDFSCTVLNSSFIIAGGILMSGEATDSVECMDLRTLKWMDLPSMETKRHSFGMVTLNGCVYAMGGENRSSGRLVSLEKYDAVRRQWQSMSSMRTSSSEFRYAAGSNVLCVSKKLPKHNNYEPSQYNHCMYNANGNCWIEDWLTTTGDLLGTGIWSCSSTDYLIVVSRTGITSYKLNDKSSATLAFLVIGEKYKDCALFGDRMIVYGASEFMEFNLTEKKWKTMPPLTNTCTKVMYYSNTIEV